MTKATLCLDMAIVNANVITVDKKMSKAEAVGVIGDKIVFIGSNADIKPLIKERTKVIDAKGKTLLPGFQDSHMHPLLVGHFANGVILNDAKTIPEFLQKVKEKADKTPKGQMILGSGWNQELMDERRYPTRWEIDSVAPNNPVFLIHWNCHIYLANTMLLNQKGITKDTPDPEGGTIHKNEKGEPTGILLEKAVDLVAPGFVETGANLFGREQSKEALKYVADLAAKWGLTSLVDILAGDAQVSAYQELVEEGDLAVRISFYLSHAYVDSAVNLGLKSGFGDNRLRLAGIKMVADGSLSSHTAALRKPYVDMPETTGVMRHTEEEIRSVVFKATQNGLQVDIHALGDRAGEIVLKIFKEAKDKFEPKDPRFKISHCIILEKDLIKQFAELNVIASVQPCFIMGGMHWIPRQVSPEMTNYAHAYRSLIDAGVHVAGGTDAPICTLNPLVNIYVAVTRKDLKGQPENGWHPEQRVTAEEALRMVTIEGAYSTGDEDVKGSIEVGKLADFALLSDDPLTVQPEKIKDIKNAMTIVGGKIVFSEEN